MADKGKLFKKDLDALAKKQIEISQLKIESYEKELGYIENTLNIQKRIELQENILIEKQNIKVAKEEVLNNVIKEGYELHKNTINAYKKSIKEQQNIIDTQKRKIKNQKEILSLQKKITDTVKNTWKYLMDSDKVIKSTILNLGMSSVKAEEMRTSFESSAGYVARLGGNLGDIQNIMEGFAEETGRARALSASMVKDITLIGKGTGLGIEQATKLTAQFELMGINVRETMEYVRGVVETSELMGINTTKVLKNISDNFSKLQKTTFNKGVQGFAEMAKYAEKFKIDMSQSLDSAETARSLETAVDLAAQLQVMGGEFAKTDPFQLLYQARNAPEEFQKSINEMTRGIATFRKKADGTFENYISPADIDRLKNVEKSLGLQSGELITQSRRMAEIQKMRQEMVGMGLSDTEKTLIEGMAKFNNQTGKFSVQVAGVTKDIRELTKQELNILQRQSESLEERALAAQTFDDAFRNTIEEFKTILLPMLQGVNKVLTNIRPVVTGMFDWFKELNEGKNGWLKVAGMLMGAGTLWKVALKPLIGRGAATGLSAISRIQTSIRGTKKIPTRGGITSFKGGKNALGAGVGVGTAALGIGAGIGLAAEGISSLADAMSKLDKDQAKTLKSIVTTLGIAVGVLPLVAFGIAAFAPAAAAATIPMLGFGAAVGMIGVAIGAASAGIGYMAEGLGSLITSAKDAGPALGQISLGLMGMGAGLAMIGPSALFGLPALALTLRTIEKRSDGLTKIAPALSNLTQLSGMKEDFVAVENMITTISNANLDNLKNLSSLKDLKNILTKPLKVEFTDKEVGLVSNVTLNIDGYKFVQKLGISEKVSISNKELKNGKESGRS